MIKAAGIIPARYGSQRFPGKPLASILGKPMIQRVFEQAQKAALLDRLIIATDDERILKAALSFGAEAWMTSSSHTSGTERVAEVAEKLSSPLIINIQGDEPLIQPRQIDILIEALQDEDIPMATLAALVNNSSLLADPNVVKVVFDTSLFALYFSRSPLASTSSGLFFQHIGIYGYRRDFLLRFSQLPSTSLEKAEQLEQLRALENGFKIKIVKTEFPTLSIDTPLDIIKVENFIEKGSHD